MHLMCFRNTYIFVARTLLFKKKTQRKSTYTEDWSCTCILQGDIFVTNLKLRSIQLIKAYNFKLYKYK